MGRITFIVAALVVTLTCAGAWAEEQAPAGAQEAPQAAQEEQQQGCMPDGSCCGACAGAAAAQQDNEAKGEETTAKTAGCPCAKARQQKAM